MFSFLTLIRLPNLILLGFSQYVVRWCLIYPILNAGGVQGQLSELHFFLFVLSVVLIAGAGYAINDYFDVKIDKVNKPNRVVVGKEVKRRVAMLTHVTMNVAGIGIAFYLAHFIGLWKLGLVHVMIAAGLWFYSTTFKRQFLIGNILIALFVSIVPILLTIYELIPCYQMDVNAESGRTFAGIWKNVFALSLFGLLMNFVREIVKDMQDLEGDKLYGRNTLPISLGLSKAKFVAVMVLGVVLGAFLYLQVIQWELEDYTSFYYFSFAIQLPIIALAYLILKGQSRKDFSIASFINKCILLTGVGYLFVFYYLLSTYTDAL